MKPINLLTSTGQDAGARPFAKGFVVKRPWGEYCLGTLQIAEGWYELVAEASGLILCLQDHERFNRIELQAKSGTPGYVRLSAGTYEVSVMPGARPGLHRASMAEFRPIPLLRFIDLLTRRFWQAIKGRMSVERVIELVRMAFAKRTFGIRAAGAVVDSDLGVLSAADLARDKGNPVEGDFSKRIEAVTDGPRFLIQGRDPSWAAIAAQVYSNHTVNANEPYDYVVVLGDDDVLMPDALLLFAEHILTRPQTQIIVADKWIGGRPTARVAWDPLLYWGKLPTPFAYSRGADIVATFANQSAFSIVDVPLAAAQTADVFPSYPKEPLADRPPCSIIIPTRDRADLLESCLKGLFDATPWPHEVIIVDNGSVEPATFAIFAAYAEKGLKVIRADIPFNFSTLCNLGAKAASHEYLVFLNNDVVLHREDWLERMMTFAVLPEAGAVGARLLYTDGRLQHGGVVLGLTQLCGHLWRGTARDIQDAEPRLLHSSLRSAVTGACLCVARRKYETVGGFDEKHYPVTLNDVALCLKLQEAGFFNIYSADAEAYHLESESRGADEDAKKAARRSDELKQFNHCWQAYRDPWLPHVVSQSTEQIHLR